MSARGYLFNHPLAGLFVSAGGAALAWVIVSILWPAPIPVVKSDYDPLARLCDVEVNALLHSKDLTEITRAEIIIREIPCAVGRRVP